MPRETIHRFEAGGRRYAIDPETCFCFECDDVSWDVLEHYPHATVNAIVHALAGTHDARTVHEVIGELEWLRSTKSILTRQAPQDMIKDFKVNRGLRVLSVQLPEPVEAAAETGRRWFRRDAAVVSNDARERGRDAVGMLLSRAGDQQELTLRFLERGCVRQPDLLADLCGHALKMAGLAGKKLDALVRIDGVALSGAPDSLAGHDVSVELAFAQPGDGADRDLAAHLRAFTTDAPHALGRLAKALQPGEEGVSGRIIVRPNHPDFGGAVAVLHQAGFRIIELDLDGAFIAHPDLDPASMLPALGQTAVYYAGQLLKRQTFRVDPIATVFHQIHEGKAVGRSDPAGTNELAVDSDGAIYPSWRLLGVEAYRLGSVAEGALDDKAVRRFDDVGALTTGPCRRCWVRNLCGGGRAAVHHALTGNMRTPHEPWCEAQRQWMAAAVSAFNQLSAEGVNFTAMYASLAGGKAPARLSLLTMAKAAMQMTVSVRPIEEADAEWLVRWENWNDASYFVCQPGNALLNTQYNREMDALHPQGLEREMVVIQRDCAPVGLVRFAPELMPGTARASVYLHDPAQYRSDSVRKGFRLMLGEMSKQQEFNRLILRAAEREPALQDFVTALGFQKVGVEREALFLHGARHDVGVFILDAA